MNDDEIYQKLKSGEAPRYIKGIEGFDDSELVQWMASYHEQVKAELLEALQEMVSAIKITLRVGHERIIELGGDCDSPEVMIKGHSEIARAEAVIARALGQ